MSPWPASYIDTHVHLWDPGRLRYDWLSGVPVLNRVHGPSDFRGAVGAEGANGPGLPEKIVFVECGRHPSQNVEEAAWVSGLAVEGRLPVAGIVAHAAVETGAEVAVELEALARWPLVKGVRRLLQDEADDAYCLRPGFVEGVRCLARFGFSFDLCIFHRQLASVVRLVELCPEVSFVLDHLGKPGVRAGLFEPWATELKQLAALPNVVCKISGLTTEADPAKWREEQLRPYLEHALSTFGPGRVLFGGDWPVSTLATTYPRWLRTVASVVEASGWSEADRGRLFRDNAVSVYRL